MEEVWGDYEYGSLGEIIVGLIFLAEVSFA